MKKFFSLIIFGLYLFTLQVSFAGDVDFRYRVHIENYGWLPIVGNGEITGSIGKSLRMEALVIKMTDDGRNMVKYCAHVENYGWQGWQDSGNVAGTTDKSLRMEAVRIKLEPRYSNKYDIYYRAHVQNGGWLGWAKNGEPAGTVGAGLRMEAIQISLVNKGAHFNRGGTAFYEKRNRSQHYI